MTSLLGDQTELFLHKFTKSGTNKYTFKIFLKLNFISQ